MFIKVPQAGLILNIKLAIDQTDYQLSVNINILTVHRNCVCPLAAFNLCKPAASL